MRSTLTKATAGLAAVALMAGTGVALAASNGSAKATHAKASQVQKFGAAEQTAPDTDNIQSGDQTSPDVNQASSAAQQSASDAGSVQSADKASPDASASQTGSDQSQEKGSESSSEVTNNDGPGGHADEPTNPNADHQFQGQE
jgi:hypothetical protein